MVVREELNGRNASSIYFQSHLCSLKFLWSRPVLLHVKLSQSHKLVK